MREKILQHSAQRSDYERLHFEGVHHIETAAEAESVAKEAGKTLQRLAVDIHKGKCGRNEYRMLFVKALDRVMEASAQIQGWLVSQGEKPYETR